MKFTTFIIVILLFLHVKHSQSAYAQWISNIHIENKAKGHVLEIKNAGLDESVGVKNRINTVSNRNQLVM